jgi:hypothetical protein
MRRLLFGTALVLVAALVAFLGTQRFVDLGLATVLTPIEPDTRERALIIAAGSGDVSTVRSLLAHGVRPEPETFNAAVIGAFDPIYGKSGCARHAEVARMLLDANPRLRPGNTARATVVRRATRIRGCDDVNRLIASPSS